MPNKSNVMFLIRFTAYCYPVKHISLFAGTSYKFYAHMRRDAGIYCRQIATIDRRIEFASVHKSASSRKGFLILCSCLNNSHFACSSYVRVKVTLEKIVYFFN